MCYEYLKHMEQHDLVHAIDFRTVFIQDLITIFREGHNNFSRNLVANYIRLFGDLDIPVYILNYPSLQ